MTDEIQKTAEILRSSKAIVFFGGAGVSTESGIPDFRSTDGLYHQSYAYPPETILSHRFFYAHTEVFYRFYREKMLCPGAKPNAAHEALVKLEKMGKLSAIVTQNIDGLHTAAGSEKVYELHGSTLRNYCEKCHRFFGTEIFDSEEIIPRCPCGGLVKPDVVLYEEPLDEETVNGAVRAIARADTLIIAGTSLTVYPAAALIDYFRGNNLILINKTPTPRDNDADIVIYGKVGETLRAVMEILEGKTV